FWLNRRLTDRRGHRTRTGPRAEVRSRPPRRISGPGFQARNGFGTRLTPLSLPLGRPEARQWDCDAPLRRADARAGNGGIGDGGSAPGVPGPPRERLRRRPLLQRGRNLAAGRAQRAPAELSPLGDADRRRWIERRNRARRP